MDFLFVNPERVPDFDRSISEWMDEEVCLIKFSHEITPETSIALLKRCLRRSAETTWVIDLKDIHGAQVREVLEKVPLKNICLEFDLKGRLGEWPVETLASLHPIVRSASAKELAEAIHIFKKKYNLLAKVNLIEENLSELFPLLSYAMEEIKYIYLDPQKLNAKTHYKILNNVFSQLEMFAKKKTYIFFFGHEWERWNNLTLNKFSGPCYVDIDTSNSCNQNCTFCGLYAPKADNSPAITEFKRQKIDEERCMRLLDELPPTVRELQFGGVGDPFTHRHIMPFITKAMKKGFMVEVLTNFSFMTRTMIDELHALACRKGNSLKIYVNISGVTPETYTRTRPNQGKDSFRKIIESLEYASKIQEKRGKGILLIPMFVACRSNYHEIPEIVRLGARLNAHAVWIKPLEIHGQHTLELVIEKEDQLEYALQLSKALQIADELGVDLMNREMIEEVVDDHLGGNHEDHPPPAANEGNSAFATKVQNGMLPNKFFATNPCRIGHMYMRVKVDGQIQPCCVMRPIASLEGNLLSEIWHSGAYQEFRTKLGSIHKEKFHLYDPEWFICQQCPHLVQNEIFKNALRTH